MKTLIISIFAVVMLLFVHADVFAQQRGMSPDASAAHQMAVLYSDQLDLSEAQKKQIAEIMAGFRMEMREQRQVRQRATERRTMQSARVEKREAALEQVREVLTPEQRDKLSKLSEQAAESRAEMHEYMTGAYVNSVADQIGLEESKAAQIAEIIKEHRAEMQPAVRERGQRQVTREDRAKRMEHRAELEEKIRGLLSEEEFEEWKNAWNEVSPGWGRGRGDRNWDRGRNQNR